MTQDVILANAQLILLDEVIRGSVRLTDGVISDISTGTNVPCGAIDCEGDYVAPGLVELHTDNLDRHLAPRPKVNWPHRAAILGHDRELAACGITTVFDALRVGLIVSGALTTTGKYARQIASEIAELHAANALKISHHLHLRAETCSETLIEELAEFGPDDRIGIVSMMDHTPGQRQFSDLVKYKAYVSGKYGLDDAAIKARLNVAYGLRDKVGAKHEAAIVAAAKRFGATLASHDDTTAAHAMASRAHGVTMAEFPTTIEAAKACHANGIATILGAPSIVRGASHSGNVSAMTLAEEGRLDIISSDYVPAALLKAALMVGAIWDDLPRAMGTVTHTPAKAVGLDDRGTIGIGQRADLIRFGMIEGDAAIKGVWSQGQRVS